MKLIKDFYEQSLCFYEEFTNDCLSNVCAQVLEAYRVKDYFLRLNCNWSIHMVYHSLSRSEYTLVYDEVPLLLQDAGATRLFSRDICSEQELWNMIQLNLERDNPIVVGVDRFFLPYHKDYQKKNGAHAIILCGYNNQERVVYFKDWYEQYHVNGKLRYTDFDKAHASQNSWNKEINSGRSLKNATLQFDFQKLQGNVHNLESTLRNVEQWYRDDKPSVNFQALNYIFENLLHVDGAILQDRFQSAYRQLYRLYQKKCLYVKYIQHAKFYIRQEAYNKCWKSVTNLELIWKNWMLTILFIAEADREKRIMELMRKFKEIYRNLLETEQQNQEAALIFLDNLKI